MHSSAGGRGLRTLSAEEASDEEMRLRGLLSCAPATPRGDDHGGGEKKKRDFTGDEGDAVPYNGTTTTAAAAAAAAARDIEAAKADAADAAARHEREMREAQLAAFIRSQSGFAVPKPLSVPLFTGLNLSEETRQQPSERSLKRLAPAPPALHNPREIFALLARALETAASSSSPRLNGFEKLLLELWDEAKTRDEGRAEADRLLPAAVRKALSERAEPQTPSASKPLHLCTAEEVGRWLTQVGLSRWIGRFAEAKIDGEACAAINHEELREKLNVWRPHHRRSILRAIRNQGALQLL